MTFSSRLLATGACAVAISLVSYGCSDNEAASSPVAPSPTAAAGDTIAATSPIQTIIDVGSLGDDTIGLKATPPTPASPINSETINSKTPALVATAARGTYQDATFEHVFALYNVTGGQMTLIETGVVPAGAGSPTFQLLDELEGNSNYQWRVRARRDGSYGPWSAYASFGTPSFVVVGVPTPTFPIDGITVSDFLPVFNVINGTDEGVTGEVIYQVQVSTDPSFGSIVQEVGTHARSRGDTNIPLSSPLAASTHYYWRVRGRDDGQGKTAFAPDVAGVVSDFSSTQDFFTPDQPTGPTNAPGKGICCPPVNRLDIVLQVNAATGSLLNTNPTQFTREVAQCLATIDGDYGMRLNDSGTIGKDTIAYRVGGQNNNPHSTDIAVGVTTPNPQLQWGDHGRVGGSWLGVDGSKCVLGVITAN